MDKFVASLGQGGLFVFSRRCFASESKKEILSTEYPDIAFCFKGTHRLKERYYVVFIDFTDIVQSLLETFLEKFRPQKFRSYSGALKKEGLRDENSVALKESIIHMIESLQRGASPFEFLKLLYEPFCKEYLVGVGTRSLSDSILKVGIYDTLHLGPFDEPMDLPWEEDQLFPVVNEPNSWNDYLSSFIKEAYGLIIEENESIREALAGFIPRVSTTGPYSSAILNIIKAQLACRDCCSQRPDESKE